MATTKQMNLGRYNFMMVNYCKSEFYFCSEHSNQVTTSISNKHADGDILRQLHEPYIMLGYMKSALIIYPPVRDLVGRSAMIYP